MGGGRAKEEADRHTSTRREKKKGGPRIDYGNDLLDIQGMYYDLINSGMMSSSVTDVMEGRKKRQKKNR